MSILMKLAYATQLAGKQLALGPRRVAVSSRRTVTTASVTKSDLINQVATGAKLTPKQAQTAVNLLLENIVKTVSNGEKVVIPGFGTFEQRVRKARKGRNPKTGEEMQLPETKTPGFTAGRTFKESVKTAK